MPFWSAVLYSYQPAHWFRTFASPNASHLSYSFGHIFSSHSPYAGGISEAQEEASTARSGAGGVQLLDEEHAKRSKQGDLLGKEQDGF